MQDSEKTVCFLPALTPLTMPGTEIEEVGILKWPLMYICSAGIRSNKHQWKTRNVKENIHIELSAETMATVI